MIHITSVQPDILFAWRGPSLLITNSRGECGPDHPLTGYYFRETRCLSELRLLIDGKAPWPCDAGTIDPRTLAFTFIHPEKEHYGLQPTGWRHLVTSQSDPSEKRADEDQRLPDRALDVRLTLAVEPADLQITARITNRSRQAVDARIGWRIGADFTGMLDAFQATQQVDAGVESTTGDAVVTYRYTHAQLPFESTIRATGPGEWTSGSDRLETSIRLESQQPIVLRLVVEPRDPDLQVEGDTVMRQEQVLARWREQAARVYVPQNRIAERIVARAIEDLGALPLLEGNEREWLAPQAGLPRFPGFFGRDALTTGWQGAMVDRAAILEATLTLCDRLQATSVDAFRDAEPGRIVYQLRHSPAARLDKTPEGLGYADFASSLMYVISLANLHAWTGDNGLLGRHWDTARRVIDWARTYGDRDGDGYLEYKTMSPQGPKHQGWKDSEHAVVYEDGREVDPPVATCELQGYWFAALQMMAVLSAVRGQIGDARDYWSTAQQLKERFNRDWWSDEDGFYGLALDPDKRLVRTATSNVGHCLTAGILQTDRLPRVVGRLFAPDMFSGWGIRTMSSEHPSYNPLSYHLGSVWAVENATIAFGLRRFGFNARMLDVAEAVFQLAERYPAYRVPECVGGYPRDERATPGAFPIADPVQTWNTSAYPLLVQTILGLQPLAPVETLIVDPVLPPWMPEVVVRGLRVGRATVTLRFERQADGAATFDVLHRQGTLKVVRQPPPESLTATAADRFGALFESLLPSRLAAAV